VTLYIVERSQSILLREIIAVFCDIHMDYILSYTVWRKVDILTLMQAFYVVTSALRVK